MSRFRLQGGKRLRGTFQVSGMKNAATPLIAASIIMQSPVTFSSVPHIIDVERMLQLVSGLGVSVKRTGAHVAVNPTALSDTPLDETLIKRLRSSVLLMGPLLAKFGHITIPMPGGCYIGSRSIDTHLGAFRQLGIHVTEKKNEYFTLTKKKITGSEVILSEFSVTATENIVIFASTLPQTTKIFMAAAEPHVQALCEFLVAAGAHIKGIGTHELEITGSENLSCESWQVIPDQIEIGTIAIAAAVTEGEVSIQPVIPRHLMSIITKLQSIGVECATTTDTLKIKGNSSYKNFTLQALPHPGFPTDLQAPMAVLATQAHGLSLIHDPMYNARFSYIQELSRMGAQAVVCDPHRVLISGKTKLHGERIKSFDLRAGATLILAGLIADGETIIEGAEMVDRGYESLEKRLSGIGAIITREQDSDE